MEQGIGVSKGYAIGSSYLVVKKQNDSTFCSSSAHPEEEAKRLQTAVEKAKAQILEIAGETGRDLDEKHAEIVKSQVNYLEDPAFVGEAFRAIRKNSVSAEKAITDITQELFQMFSEFSDEYTRERADDIRDIGDRILNNLLCKAEETRPDALPDNTVLFAKNLKPSDTARIDRNKVIAFVTEEGGQTSHTAILAKAMGIVAVVGCTGILDKVKNGMSVIVDGSSGNVILSPDKDTAQKYRALQEESQQRKKRLAAHSGGILRRKDGKQVSVEANIGNLEDLKIALKNGADGVGLFRTEFLYMGRDSIPSEEEQYHVYREAAELLGGKPLTIRTLDIGGDKKLPYLKQPAEANPFLGLRAIRLCLKHPEIFKPQLRAILRASAYGKVRVMFPMIGNLRELEQAQNTLSECKQELEQAGINFDHSIETGMMVEIPSAAILADKFATEVDFFSIGTNDLTQYTLAVDRMNETISDLYDSMHPAVLKLIHRTIEAAHRASISCCMCGELASDEKAADVLLKYGLDEFSVSPGLLAEVKGILSEALGG